MAYTSGGFMTNEQKIERIRELTPILSEAARAYEQEDREIMSNFEYDRLYDELKQLEDETGMVLADSPTHKVGFEVLSELPKEKHESPMLSLNKTKSREELSSWLGSHNGILSWKMDGLTVVLTYRNGELYKAVTRGNGEIGEVITNNAKVFKNVPLTIPYKGELVLRGEAVIRYSDFEKINASIPDADAKYKNPRNLCSGSVRQLDNSITAQRCVYLYAFALISMNDAIGSADNQNITQPAFSLRSEQFRYLQTLGFDVVEYKEVNSENVTSAVQYFADKIVTNDFPSDGLVLIYDDIAYGQSLGRTAKFPRDGIAFKWADDTAETTLLDIEWSASRTGLINPVAIFEPVELEGTTVSRASLHNISIMRDMKLGTGDRITVYKANMIIPQLADNLTQSAEYIIKDEKDTDENNTDICNLKSGIPIAGSRQKLCIFNTVKENITSKNIASLCPICGKQTIIHYENDVMTLYCENTSCAAKKIKLLALLASRNALNIDGLSEQTIEKLIDAGLLHNLSDIFHLNDCTDKIAEIDKMGKKSASNLIEAIEKARTTTLSRLLYSLGIPNIGLSNAKLICKHVNDDPDQLTALSYEELIEIEGIGDVLAQSYTEYFKDETNLKEYHAILKELKLEKETASGNSLQGMVFVITGSVYKYENRNALKAHIEDLGGKVTGSVTKNTTCLINNDITSNSSKNKTAKELGIEIITEDTFIERYGQ